VDSKYVSLVYSSLSLGAVIDFPCACSCRLSIKLTHPWNSILPHDQHPNDNTAIQALLNFPKVSRGGIFISWTRRALCGKAMLTTLTFAPFA
jgi:hypothetical protein